MVAAVPAATSGSTAATFSSSLINVSIYKRPLKMPTESDWKKFSALVPVIRERYLTDRNARITALLTAPKKTETERFWDAMAEMEKEAKILHQCLDDHSRSKLWLFVRLMIYAGMLKKEDLTGFSDELQREAAYVFDGK